MSERDGGSKPANGKRVQSGLAPGTLFGLAVVMVVAANGLGGRGPAAVVAIVLAEAIALYVGYGALTRVADPAIYRLVASD